MDRPEADPGPAGIQADKARGQGADRREDVGDVKGPVQLQGREPICEDKLVEESVAQAAT